MKKIFFILVFLVFALHAHGYRKRIQKRSAIQPVPSGFPTTFPGSFDYIVTGTTTATTTSRLASIATSINTATCLTISASATPTGDHIEFDTDGTGCLPNQFGRTVNGKTTISISASCSEEELARILLSALGLHYMHQRGDRDYYVGIEPQTGATTSIRVPIPALLPQTFGLPYQFTTIMNVAAVDSYNFYRADGTCSAAVAVPTGTSISFWDTYMLNQLYSCTLMTACTTNPCQNGATCYNGFTMGSFFCDCLPGYTGANCETNASPCTPDPCENGGTCVPGTGGVHYTCQCAIHYTGHNCEIGLVLPGWSNGLNGHQYLLSPSTMTWLDANKYCLDRDSTLAFTGVRNPATFNLLFNVLFSTQNIWIALTKWENRFRWSVDGIGTTSHTWTKWGTNEPDVNNDDTHCASVHGTTTTARQMFTTNCDWLRYALCEKPIGYPGSFPTYKASNGLIYFLTPPMSFDAAKRECQRFGGWLAVDGVATTSLLATIADNLMPSDPSPAPKFFFVGYEDRGSSGTFKPVKTGTAIQSNDARWNSEWNDPNNYGGIEECVASKRGIPGVAGSLVDIDCGSRKLRHGLCEANELILTERNCPSGKTCPKDSKCVYLAVNGAELCKCKDGFYMLNGACHDVNECDTDSNLCGVGGTCVNCRGSYTCHCTGTTYNLAQRKCL